MEIHIIIQLTVLNPLNAILGREVLPPENASNKQLDQE